MEVSPGGGLKTGVPVPNYSTGWTGSTSADG